MALFEGKKNPFTYEVVREGDDVILMVDCENYTRLPSIEDDPMTMAKTCDMLNEVNNATKIVFMQKRNYEYDYGQTLLIAEIARLYNQLIKRKDVIGYSAFADDPECAKFVGAWYADVQQMISNLLRSDPLGAYVELKRLLRDERIKLERQ